MIIARASSSLSNVSATATVFSAIRVRVSGQGRPCMATYRTRFSGEENFQADQIRCPRCVAALIQARRAFHLRCASMHIGAPSAARSSSSSADARSRARSPIHHYAVGRLERPQSSARIASTIRGQARAEVSAVGRVFHRRSAPGPGDSPPPGPQLWKWNVLCGHIANPALPLSLSRSSHAELRREPMDGPRAASKTIAARPDHTLIL